MLLSGSRKHEYMRRLPGPIVLLSPWPTICPIVLPTSVRLWVDARVVEIGVDGARNETKDHEDDEDDKADHGWFVLFGKEGR